ncbi:hypothetical protein PVAND_009751 [Polypedilum vanderplanki]|uniref:ERAP1-like C-terminal domain-containing protein n=1 Tax=Polypedilum vanderplanki TaxID=319348 RepID=A0A9J6CDP9_POLVA|nr:hypothetical protein PVAND_009751 [Polypedilum vanderplanki]
MILNIQQVGYYRVDYDTALWQAIISQLNENHEEIHSINRAILQEEIALAWTEFNRVTVAHILEILNYFDKEFDSITWSKAYDNLNRLNERLFGTYAYDTFLEFVVRITENQINETGYNGFDGEDPERTSLRSFIKPWNCWANYEKCSVQDHAEFLKYYIDGNQLAVFDYCNAIKLVNKTMFDDILNNVLTNSVFANRILFLANLGCSPVAENLQNLLNSILNVLNTLTRPERAQIIANTYTKSSIALEITLDFLDQNAAALYDIMGEFIEQLLMSMPSYINGQKNTAKYQSILTKFHGFGLISNENLNKATDSVASNNAWITQNYKNILDYFGLEEITDPPTTTPNTTPIASTPSQTSTAASDEPTTLAPTTTTQGASSIMVSMFIMFFCVIISFIFTK